jgi:uncharacterized repeat protein (TIGR01451 family)
MNKLSMIATTTVTGVALATAVVSPALAWHPQGAIVKQVQNVTAGTTMSDANTSGTAIAAKPGDTLTYKITVSNPAQAAEKNYNDLAFVKLTDTLPSGVELIGNANQRQINEDLGTILPGKSVTKTYTVKVTATNDGVIENKACFTGNSVVKDAPRNGCDTANVKVSTPPVVTPPATVTPPVTPSVTPAGKGSVTPAPAAATVAAPTELPKTGPADVVAMVAAASVIGYALNVLRLKRAFSFQR